VTLQDRGPDGGPGWREEPRRPSIRPSVGRITLEPRKLPRQARARATFDAIVAACGQVLASGPYDALTTNGISERAGVSIGTLYEYFPNRESIVAALAANSCARLVARMEEAIQETIGMGQLEGAEHLLMAGVEALGSRENAFKVMLRGAPFVTTLPAMTEARGALTGLCQAIRTCSQDTLSLPSPEADTWLISQMLFNAMLEIAFLDAGDAERRLLCHELAIMTCRMALGHDVAEAPAAPH
jgi:AcrR family transcriptional regulator